MQNESRQVGGGGGGEMLIYPNLLLCGWMDHALPIFLCKVSSKLLQFYNQTRSKLPCLGLSHLSLPSKDSIFQKFSLCLSSILHVVAGQKLLHHANT